MSLKRRCPECEHPNEPYEVEACQRCDYRFLWRRHFGRKGYNRVTVYERTHGGPKQVLYWNRQGAQRETLTNLAGSPILDRGLAEKIGRRMSEAQAEARKAKSAAELMGVPERHTVRELFEQLHRDRKGDWSDKWATDQRRYRRFWEKRLGKDTVLQDVNPALVSRIVAQEAEKRDWSDKTRNHYLNAAVEAWNYAETHLKWIAPQENLEAVRRHKVHADNMELAYSEQEAVAILTEAPGIDLRCAVAGELAFVGGRRINAIRVLQTRAYRTETQIVPLPGGETRALEFGVVTFPARTDKARKRGEVYLFGRSKELLEKLLATPACQASGLLFPKWDLQASDPPDEPINIKWLRRWLRKAEEAAGVPNVKGRSYHGFNRAFATAGDDPKAMSGQSGKTEAVIFAIYRQPKPSEKAALAVQLDDLRRGA